MEKTVAEKLEVLKKIASRLNEQNITWGVGASVLLYFKGITDVFHDIDIMTVSEDIEKVRELFYSMGELLDSKPNDDYRTSHFYEFVIDGVDIDVMEGFRIVKDGTVHGCSFTEGSVYEYRDLDGVRIPLQSVSDWRNYYGLMGRTNKVEMIDNYLQNGRQFDEDMLEAMFEPLIEEEPKLNEYIETYGSLEAYAKHVISLMSKREKQVLISRYGLYDGVKKNYEEIGKELGVVKERARQLERIALRKLKKPDRAERIRRMLARGSR